jgi:diaminohydroxyphosphoribosylaminopyrimidine deaminase/5-amino-6-(5-phosphoribosylamino)uracil reductase
MATPAETAAMRRALVLAAEAVGISNPNPPVGAVVLSADGQVVGEGRTQQVGGPHAEVMALRAAGPSASGGTLVVSLEPCRHTGRTGPCTEAIEAAGIRRVVFAVGDPNGDAAGGGEDLRGRGMDVESGVLADDAAVTLGPWHVEVRRNPRRTDRRAGRHQPLDHRHRSAS